MSDADAGAHARPLAKPVSGWLGRQYRPMSDTDPSADARPLAKPMLGQLSRQRRPVSDTDAAADTGPLAKPVSRQHAEHWNGPLPDGDADPDAARRTPANPGPEPVLDSVGGRHAGAVPNADAGAYAGAEPVAELRHLDQRPAVALPLTHLTARIVGAVFARPAAPMDAYFGISRAGSTVPRELRAGLTTFLTMSCTPCS